MPTQPYYLKDGTRVPGVTTIIHPYGDCGGLMHWAWDCGMQGKDYRKERDRAADAGTLAHKAVDAWIRGQDFHFVTEFEASKKAENAFNAFLDWVDRTRLEVTDTEIPMISEMYRYGGTADGFTIQGKRSVLDWKSSGGIYPEYLIQIRAYGELWNETHPTDPIVGGYHLIRFDKEYGDFHHHFWEELDSSWLAFKHLRDLYELNKELKKRAK